ncbi:MAG: hypothetical protein KJ621_05455 [Proteobacteria bacterium]|nr:hypothetical protein [Pseudomonadota bacterium]
MSDEILIIGTKAQIRVLGQYPHLITGTGEENVGYCASTNALNLALTGSDTPEDQSSWKPPKKVYFTGQIRQYGPEGMGMTIDDPVWVEEECREYGVKALIKIDMNCP